MHRLIAALIIAAVACLLASPAWAELSSVWAYQDFNTTASGVTLNVPMFDTDGGRYFLTGVTVSVYHQANAYFGVDNDTNQNRTVYAREVRSWSVSGADVSSSVNNYTWQTANRALGRENNGPDGGTYSTASPDGYYWGRIGYGDTLNSTHLIGSAFYNQYQQSGGGNTAFTLNATNLTNQLVWVGGTPGSWQSSVTAGNPNLRISLKVDYEWAAVPEPATWGLLGLGVVVLALRRRRRK